MTNTKHTPGPWVIAQSTSDDRVIWIEPFGGGTLGFAVLYSKGRNGEIFGKDNVKANAHLIAAAPELLEALKRLLDPSLNPEVAAGDIKQARAVIAKAMGN